MAMRRILADKSSNANGILNKRRLFHRAELLKIGRTFYEVLRTSKVRVEGILPKFRL